MFSVTQIIILLLIEMFFNAAGHIWVFLYGSTVLKAFVIGLVMGDIPTALMIGSTYQLMSMGLIPIGGSSVPNYSLGTMVGIPFAIALKDVNAGLAVGTVAATLGTSLDVVWKMSDSWFLHKIQNSVNNCDFASARKFYLFDFIWGVIWDCIPVFLTLTAGAVVVNAVIDHLPKFLLTGFGVAGNILPGLGFAILLRTLPAKDFFPFILIGWFCFSYAKWPILGISILGVAMAMLYYKITARNTVETAVVDDMEVEVDE